MKDIDQVIYERAMTAEAACTRITNAIEAGDAIRGVKRFEGDVKTYLVVDAGGTTELICVQSILDLADLIEREPLL